MRVLVIPPLNLTPSQYEIAVLAMDGMTNRAIAIALGVTLPTVNNQWALIYEKLGIRNRTELAVKLWWETEGNGKEGNS